MNILKALLLTVLLIAFGTIIRLGIFESIEEYVPINYLVLCVGLFSVISKIIAYLLIFKIFKIKFNWKSGQKKLRTVNLNVIFYILIITIGLKLIYNPIFDFSSIINFIKGIEVEPYLPSQKIDISLISNVILYLIIAPIFEELLFRKYMYIELLKKYSQSLSIIISSILFSLIHLPNYKNLIPTFILGIICCTIYRKTKNIYHTIILHFLMNLSWLLLMYYGNLYYKLIFDLNYNLIYWLLFLIGIVLIFLGIKKITTANN